MAWPKGQKRPDAFQKRKIIPTVDEIAVLKHLDQQTKIAVDLPVNDKLSDVIQQLKEVLKSYRCDVETKIIEMGNVTTEVSVTIRFLIR